jgi:hypothetical protein
VKADPSMACSAVNIAAPSQLNAHHNTEKPLAISSTLYACVHESLCKLTYGGTSRLLARSAIAFFILYAVSPSPSPWREDSLHILPVSCQYYPDGIKRYRIVELCSLMSGDVISNLEPPSHILPDVFAHWAVNLT